jgi:hypothetical protein
MDKSRSWTSPRSKTSSPRSGRARRVATISTRSAATRSPQATRRDDGASGSNLRTVRRRLSLIRGRARRGSLLIRSPHSRVTRHGKQRHVQLMNRTGCFVDRQVDPALLIVSSSVQSLAAAAKEREHRPDSVPQRFGLLLSDARKFHADSVYEYTLVPARRSLTGHHLARLDRRHLRRHPLHGLPCVVPPDDSRIGVEPRPSATAPPRPRAHSSQRRHARHHQRGGLGYRLSPDRDRAIGAKAAEGDRRPGGIEQAGAPGRKE